MKYDIFLFVSYYHSLIFKTDILHRVETSYCIFDDVISYFAD